MRSPLRAASLLALAAAVLSCTDATTAPGTTQQGAFRAARLRMSPSFSPAAARAYASLADLGLQLTLVRVRLENAAGVVVKDTTIAFPADQDTLTVSLPVQIEGSEQTFAATIELRDANGTVFFSRTQQVTARDASLPPVPSPVLELVFVGPGAAARTMTLSPASGSITPGTLPQLVASALDADGNPVTDLLVASWTSSDTTIATVSATTGTTATVRGTGRRGATTFTATTLGGVAGTAQLTFLPQPAQLAVAGGGGQTGPAGHELAQPFVVQLLGVDGLGIAGQAVAFRGVTTGGQVTTATATTDVNGKALTVITPARTPGTFVFEATSGTLSATIQGTAVAGPPSQLVVTQPFPPSLNVGAAPPLPFQGQVSDDMGNAVPQAGVKVDAAVSVVPSGQSMSATGTSDPNGVVSITLPPYVGQTGTATITLTSPVLGTISTTTVPVTAGPAAALQLVQQPAGTASSGAPLATAPAVQLVDVGGNAVASALAVTVSLGDGQPGTLGGTTTVTTGSDGRATFPGLTISAPVGSFTLKFTAAALPPVTSSAIALTAGAAAKLVWLTTPPDQIAVEVAVTPTPRARLADAQGNPVRTAGVKLRERGSGPNGVFLDSALTDVNGEADLPIRPYRGPVATLRLSVTSDGLDSLVKLIVAVAGAPAGLVLAQAPPATAVNGVPLSPAPVVQLVDAGGNPATGVFTVTAELLDATGTLAGTTQVPLDGAGRASFDALSIVAPSGSYAIRFTAGGLSSVTTALVTVGPGAATQLLPSTELGQAGTVGTPAPLTPIVRVLDAAGNGVPGVNVTFTPGNGSTVNGGTAGDAVATDANGLATARNWTLGTLAGSYSLDATSAGLTGSPIRFVATAAAGAPARYQVLASSSNAAAGQTLTVTAQLVDRYDNAVRSDAHTVAWSVAPAGAGGFGAAASQTDVNGLATVAYTAPTAAPASVVVTAAEGGLTGSTSPVSVTPGSASMLGFSGGWSVPGSTPAGAPFSTQPVVQIRDANGNTVATSGVLITATIASGPAGATLVNETATTSVQGQASFSGIALGGSVGTYTLSFSAPGYVPTSSGNLQIGPGPAASVAAQAGAGQTAAPGANVPTAPVVVVKDGYGNGVSGIAVTFSTVDATAAVSDGTSSGMSVTVSTNASGIAGLSSWTLGTTAGTQTLQAGTAPALTGSPVSFTANAVATAATKLGILVAPSTTAASGAPLATQPVIVLLDANGNRVAQAGVNISAVLASGVGSERQNMAVTDTTGAATFTSLTLLGTAGPVTVRFDGGTLASVTSETITLTAGAVEGLTIVTQPPATAESGVAFPQQPAVALRDGSGNRVAQAGVVVTATLTSGTGTITGGSATTDASGLAQFSGLAVTGSPARLTLTLSSGAMTVMSTAFDLVLRPLGPATHFVVVSGGSQSATVTDTLPAPVVIEARDANDQAVPNVPVKVTYDRSGGQQGYIQLAGVNYNCDCYVRDSVNTDEAGRASFTWRLSNRAKVDSVMVGNATIPATVATAAALPGPAVGLVFVAPSGLDDDLGNTLTPFQVVFTDIGGYDTVAVNGPVTITLNNAMYCDGTCPPPPAPNGTLTVNAVNGVASFDDVQITQTGFYNFSAVSGPYAGQSDGFDISPVGPHFVVVTPSPLPATAPVGTVLQIQLRSQTAHGDPLPDTPIIVSSNGNGSLNLAGGTYGGSRDSSRTDAQGLITLTWTMPDNATYSTAAISNYETVGALTLGISAVAGPASKIVTYAGGSLDGVTGSTLRLVNAQVTDANGNAIYGASGTVTVSLSGGDGTATLGGTLAQTLSSGSASFGDLTIDKPGTGYRLTFTSGALAGESATFDIVAAPAAIVPAGSGRTLVTQYDAGGVPFLVKDASGNPFPNAAVTFAISSTTSCYLTGTSGTTDGAGVTSAYLNATATEGGCSVTATTANGLTASARFVSKASVVTHVWFGGAEGDAISFGNGSNWSTTGAYTATPDASSVVLIPDWGDGLRPKLAVSAQIQSLHMNSGSLDLGGFTLTTTGDVLAQGASLVGGAVSGGGSGVTIKGAFDALYVGQADQCDRDDATLTNVSANALFVVCKTTIGAAVTAKDLSMTDNSATAQLLMGGSSSLTVESTAKLGGAIQAAGNFAIDGNADFNGATVNSALESARISVRGDAHLFGGTKVERGIRLDIGGKGIFTDGITSADTVIVRGDAVFDDGRFELPAGVLELHQSLTQTNNAIAGVGFYASGDHLTRFVGREVNGADNYGTLQFARIQIENGTTNFGRGGYSQPLTIPNDGTDSTRVNVLPGATAYFQRGFALASGNIHVGAAATLEFLETGSIGLDRGVIRLFDRATLNAANAPGGFYGTCKLAPGMSAVTLIGNINDSSGANDPTRTCTQEYELPPANED